jgi:hypothetical protein
MEVPNKLLQTCRRLCRALSLPQLHYGHTSAETRAAWMVSRQICILRVRANTSQPKPPHLKELRANNSRNTRRYHSARTPHARLSQSNAHNRTHCLQLSCTVLTLMYNRPMSSVVELEREIAELAARIDVANHRLLTCIREFYESEEWARQGALSCAHWLSWRIGLDLVTARERVRVARALGQLPAIDAAMTDAGAGANERPRSMWREKPVNWRFCWKGSGSDKCNRRCSGCR